MLNVDKYRDELLEEMDNRREKVEGRCDDNYSGVEIYFRSIEDVKRKHGGGHSALFSDDVEWLFSEYEPPLLKNGDGLKPGDWIMVRQYPGEEWKRLKFVLFDNDFFYALCEGEHLDKDYIAISRWQQARLPEDGE